VKETALREGTQGSAQVRKKQHEKVQTNSIVKAWISENDPILLGDLKTPRGGTILD